MKQVTRKCSTAALLGALIAGAGAAISVVGPWGVTPAHAETTLFQEPDVIKAIRVSDFEKLRALLIRGENPNSVDFEGENGVIVAARAGDVDAIQLLLKFGGSVDWQDKIGNTALSWAANAGDYDTVSALLEAGANPNIANRQGITPLIVAVDQGYRDVVHLLLDYNADPAHRDFTGRSVLDHARNSRDRQIGPIISQALGQ